MHVAQLNTNVGIHPSIERSSPSSSSNNDDDDVRWQRQGAAEHGAQRAGCVGAEPVAETVAWVLTTATAAAERETEREAADRREREDDIKEKAKNRAAIKRQL